MFSTTAATTAIWGYWTSTMDTTTTGSSYLSTEYLNNIYRQWVDNSTTAITTGTNIYRVWVSGNTVIGQDYHPQQIIRNPESMRERQERNDKIIRAKAQARKRSIQLLRDSLTTIQRKEFDQYGYFFVNSPSGKLYRIREGRSINIDLMVGNSKTIVQKRLCAHPEEFLPDGDNMLAQKVLLEHQETDFLNICNHYDPPRTIQ